MYTSRLVRSAALLSQCCKGHIMRSECHFSCLFRLTMCDNDSSFTTEGMCASTLIECFYPRCDECLLLDSPTQASRYMEQAKMLASAASSNAHLSSEALD